MVPVPGSDSDFRDPSESDVVPKILISTNKSYVDNLKAAIYLLDILYIELEKPDWPQSIQ